MKYLYLILYIAIVFIIKYALKTYRSNKTKSKYVYNNVSQLELQQLISSFPQT